MPSVYPRPPGSNDGAFSFARTLTQPRTSTGYDEKLPRPDVRERQEELNRVRPIFSLRNSMLALWRGYTRVMDEYQPIIEGRNYTDSQDDDRPIAITEPATIIKDRIRRVGGMNARIKVAADGRSQEDFSKSDKSATFGRNFRDRANKDIRAAGNGLGRQQGLTRALCEDGHAYDRIALVLDRPEMPFTSMLYDPLDCYPVWGWSNGLETMRRFYHVVKVEARVLREQFGKHILPDREDSDEIDTVNYYDDVWTGVWVDGNTDEMVRKFVKHNYGCMPVRHSFMNGWMTRSGDMPQDANIRESTRGRALIADHIGTIDRAGRYLAAQQRMLYKAVDPARVVHLGDMDAGVDVDTNPAGETTLRDPQSRIMNLPTDPSALTVLATLMQNAKESMAADQLLLDPTVARASGFDRAVASLEAQVVLNDLIVAMEDHEADVQEHILKMYKRLYSNPAQAALVGQGILDPDPSHPLGAVPMLEDEDGRRVRSKFTADDIPEYISVSVQFEVLSDINRIQMANQLKTPIEMGLISKYTGMTMMDVVDPKAELIRVREEEAMMSPDAQKILQPLYLLRSLKAQLKEAEDQDDTLAVAYLNMQIERYGKQLAKEKIEPEAPPGMPGQPPGMPSGMPQLPPGVPPPPGMDGGLSLPSDTGTQPGQLPPTVAQGGMDQMAEAMQALGGFGGM